MTDPQFFRAFDKWWAAASVKSRSAAAKEDARRAFIAGCKFGIEPRSYRFRSGQRVVTVHAASEKEAKAYAIRKLDQRAATLGAKAPETGWQLTQISTLGSNNG